MTISLAYTSYTLVQSSRNTHSRSITAGVKVEATLTRRTMALTANYPLIEDLAMKFNRHSLHDTFQLPTFYPNWQAKEFALYLQPGFIVDPNFDQATPFEFKANGTFTTKKNNRNKVQNDRTNSTKHSPRHSPKREQLKGNKPQTIHPANSCDNKERKSNAVKILDFDEDCLSDDEELSCYFSKETELCNDRFLPKSSVGSSPTLSHNRKRSMEDEDCTTIKRCCRPRLNFDKMLLNSRESRENTWSDETDKTNYFRPISPQNWLS